MTKSQVPKEIHFQFGVKELDWPAQNTDVFWALFLKISVRPL